MSARRVARAARTALGLSIVEWATLAEAWLGLLVADVSLRTRRANVPLANPSASGTNAPDEVVERVARMLLLAARHHVVPMNCLRRSLALRAMLLRRDIPAVLRLGARMNGGLDAHAWVEVEGRVVGDSEREVGRFTAFESRKVV